MLFFKETNTGKVNLAQIAFADGVPRDLVSVISAEIRNINKNNKQECETKYYCFIQVFFCY